MMLEGGGAVPLLPIIIKKKNTNQPLDIDSWFMFTKLMIIFIFCFLIGDFYRFSVEPYSMLKSSTVFFNTMEY